MTEHYPLTVNDPARTARVAAALRGQFGDDRVHELPAPVSASEDFGSFGTEWGVPSVFWYVGGTDADDYRRAEQAGRVAQDIPTNHNPRFAPVIHPTLETGVQAITPPPSTRSRGPRRNRDRAAAVTRVPVIAHMVRSTVGNLVRPGARHDQLAMIVPAAGGRGPPSAALQSARMAASCWRTASACALTLSPSNSGPG